MYNSFLTMLCVSWSANTLNTSPTVKGLFHLKPYQNFQALVDQPTLIEINQLGLIEVIIPLLTNNNEINSKVSQELSHGTFALNILVRLNKGLMARL